MRLAYRAQANRQIAELAVQIARQRAIVKDALNTGHRSEMAESLLDALEGSLRIFEKHRIFLLSCNGSSSALPPGDAVRGPCRHDATGMERHDELKPGRGFSLASSLAVAFSAGDDGGRRSREQFARAYRLGWIVLNLELSDY